MAIIYTHIPEPSTPSDPTPPAAKRRERRIPPSGIPKLDVLLAELDAAYEGKHAPLIVIHDIYNDHTKDRCPKSCSIADSMEASRSAEMCAFIRRNDQMFNRGIVSLAALSEMQDVGIAVVVHLEAGDGMAMMTPDSLANRADLFIRHVRTVTDGPVRDASHPYTDSPKDFIIVERAGRLATSTDDLVGFALPWIIDLG